MNMKIILINILYVYILRTILYTHNLLIYTFNTTHTHIYALLYVYKYLLKYV
jgi:hypothetical protein